MADKTVDRSTKGGLAGAQATYNAMPPNTSLKQFLTAYATNFDSFNQMAISMGLSHGSIIHVLNGEISDSPSLRKALGILKHPRRWRVIVEADENLFDVFQEACFEYELTGSELLLDMLNVYDDVMSNMPH